ncbi:MAG: hypothetical protein OEW19_17930, partial [Acidobacteriota bacterium]|nr:hypothetical protein [Acidobacteriota bacterium]
MEPTPRTPLLIWPGLVAAILLVLVRLVLPAVAPDATVFQVPLAMLGVVGGLVMGLAVVVWWTFFSRAPRPERWGALVLMAVGLFATSLVVHPSISNGMMGMMLPIFAVPVLGLALVAGAVVSR